MISLPIIFLLWSIITSDISAQPGRNCSDSDLRQIQTATLTALNAGRLEICRNGIWGSIRASLSISSSSISFWSEKNVLVACRQLGFNGGLNSVPPNQLILADQMNADSPVHYSNVICDGTETNIIECRSDVVVPVTGTNLHNSDVYIVCLPGSIPYTNLHTTTGLSGSIGDVRLVGSILNGHGAVEILANNLGWSTICPDTSWTASDAKVICQNLGYDSGQVETYALNSPVISPRLVYDSECSSSTISSSESFSRIQAGDCTFLVSSNNCPFPSVFVAGVNCSTSRSSGSVRMISSGNSGRRQGVVEVLYDGRWGVLCRPVDETEVAQSICEGFGYKRDDASVLSISTQELQNIESRLKPLWIPNIACTSSSQGLSQCSLGSPLGYGTCARDILLVDCGGGSRSSNPTVSTSTSISFVIVIVVVIISISLYGKEHLRKLKNSCGSCWHSFTHSSLMHPSKWCTCCHRRRSRNIPATTRSYPTTVSPQSSAPSTSYPAATANSTVPHSRRSVQAEPEDLTPMPENPELTKAPPPSYQAAFDLPSPDRELPPPYPGTSVTSYNNLPSVDQHYVAEHAWSAPYPPPPPGSDPAYPPPGTPPGYLPPDNIPYPSPPPGSEPSDPAYPPPSNAPYPPPGSGPAYPPPGLASPQY